MKTLRFSPLFWCWLAVASAALAQGKGVVEGRLLDGTNPSIVVRGVELEVITLGGGMRVIQTAATDALGKFRFEGLPLDAPMMIRANYKGVNYHSPVSFDKAGKAHVALTVFEPTLSMLDIRLEGVRMVFQATAEQLKAVETVIFNNKTRPPRTFMNPEGNFRFSKAPGILEPPEIEVTSPGSSMPLVQSALESADGKSYYSLYPLKPGLTTFTVQQLLPYSTRSYTFAKKFYQDVGPIDIGVIPQDLILSGNGLAKIQEDPQRAFAVYRSAPIRAGSEVVWTFSGGTTAPESGASESSGDHSVTEVPNGVGRNALVIGPLLLMGFILVLWYAFNHFQDGSQKAADIRIRQLKERQEQLLDSVAGLDRRFESRSVGRQEFLAEREKHKRELRRIFLLLKKP
jgi:hypothetical protein